MNTILEWLKSGSPAHWQYIALVAYMAFEDWLPKTKKLQANSVLQLIAQSLQFLLAKNAFVQGAAKYLMAPPAAQNPEQK